MLSRLSTRYGRNTRLVRRLASTTTTTTPFLDIHLPEINVPEPEPPIQIPFAPDFWESSSLNKTASASEPVLPKLLMLDPETHPGSHNLLDESNVAIADASSPQNTESRPATESGQGGLLDDMSEDLGIPLRLTQLKNLIQRALR